MQQINNDDYAFPTSSDNPFSPKGMTLRDYFAAKVLNSYLSASQWIFNKDELCSTAYKWADAMLKAREK